MRRAIALAATLLVASYAADEPITVCDALQRRGSLKGTRVSIRGIQVATGEGVWLTDVGCSEHFMVGGKKLRALIWLDLSPGGRRTAGIDAPGLQTSVQRVNRELANRGFDLSKDRLWLTFEGVLQAREDVGLGHLNAAPASLIVVEMKNPLIEHDRNTSK